MRPPTARSAEVEEKLRRVRLLLDDTLDAVVLRSPASVAWLSGGGRTHIEATPATGVAAVVVTGEDVEVATTVNEAARLQQEELEGLHADWRVLAWNDDLVSVLPRGGRVGTDVPYGTCRDLSGALEQARRSLTAEEVQRYSELGTDAAKAFTEVCSEVTGAMTERSLAARAGAALLERGIDPVVLLVAGGRRLAVHRHPLPTAEPVGELVMVVACGRRHGLIANLTRFVATAPLPTSRSDDYESLLRVDVAYQHATRPGSSVGACFEAGSRAYAAAGFDPVEWTRHHQGGPTGYATRDYLADASSDAVIEERQAFAWNPSVPCLKVEDTVLATSAGPQVLTADPAWPAVEVAGLRRPQILVTA